MSTVIYLKDLKKEDKKLDYFQQITEKNKVLKKRHERERVKRNKAIVERLKEKKGRVS